MTLFVPVEEQTIQMCGYATENRAVPAGPRLIATDLACRRGSRVLFRGLALDVGPQHIVWVRGQNGRGKTSLLRLAAGLAAPEAGQLLCEGVPVRRADASRWLFIGHGNALKEDLTAREALQFLLRVQARPCDAASADAALDRLGLASRRHAMVRTLSQGQRRRVALSRLAVDVTMAAPSLWLLDEPFDALDADAVPRLNRLAADHLRRGGSVLLSSHLPLDPSLGAIEVNLDAYPP